MLLLAAIILVVWLVAVALRSAVGTVVGGLIFCGLLVAVLGWPVVAVAAVVLIVRHSSRLRRTA